MLFEKSDRVLQLCKNSDYKHDLIKILEIYNSDKHEYLFSLKQIINLEKTENSCKEAKLPHKEVGVYIFFDKYKLPVYIGVTGEKGSKANLKQRICSQLRQSSNLSKNILEINNLILGTDLAQLNRKDLLHYLDNVLVYPCGNDIDKAQGLELLLLSVCNTKYNR